MQDKLQQIESLVRYLFHANILGVAGNKNDFGADSYECPCCGACRYVTTYVKPYANLSEVGHKADCQLVLLHDLVNAK